MKKEYTDNPLFNDMSLMSDTMRCQFPGCKELADHVYDDYCWAHEKAISDARDEWDNNPQW